MTDAVSDPAPAALEDLAARVSALERRLGQGDTDDAGGNGFDEDRFWALARLKRRLDAAGGVLLVGSVTLPGDDEVAAEWQQGATTTALLESDWADAAAPLSALGHPVRLRVLQAVLRGVSTTTELADLEEIGTRGQLHHHLRELTATGWLRSAGRGVYEIPAPRIVPLLVAVTGGRR